MRELKIIIYTATLLAFGCGGDEKSHVKQDVPLKPLDVRIENVRSEEVATMLQAVGTVRSEVTTNLSSRIMGYLTAVEVDEGDRVRRGQLLAQIDSRETATQLEKAEAGLHEAESAGEEVERAIGASKSGLEVAQANARLAESTYQRFKELLNRKSVSQQEFDEVDARYSAAQAQVHSAEEMLRSIEARKKQVEAKVNQAKSNLASAQLHHSYARIISPLDGLVTSKSAEVGQLAAPGTPLFTVEDGKNYRLEATVEESRMKFLNVSQSLTVRVDALEEDLVGKVTEILPVADPASRSFTVKIELPFHPQLRSGLFGRVSFPTQTRTLLTVPRSSIVFRGQLSGVYVVDSAQKARFQLVKAGEEMGERVEVLAGLEEGDQVVIQPVEQVQDGQPVHIVDSTAILGPLPQQFMPMVAGGSV